MSDVTDWSAIDASNNAAPPNGAPEGMAAGLVNDSMRAVMGGTRRLAEDGGWFNWGDTVTRVSATEFNAVGSGVLADRYLTNRRVRLTGTTTGDISGVITGTAGSFVVTVSLDSGAIQADANLVAFLGPTPAAIAAAVHEIAVGGVYPYFGTTAPTNTIFPFGQVLNAVSSPEFQPLYDVILNAFGGTNNTDFVVPDLRGRALFGVDDMGGVAAGRLTGARPQGFGGALGDAGGEEAHTPTIPEQVNHAHSGARGVEIVVQANQGVPQAVNASTTSTGTSGGGEDFNILPPGIVCNYVMRYR